MDVRLMTIFTILTLCISCTNTAQETKSIGQGIFTNCSDDSTKSEYSTLEQDLFAIEYPINWNEDNKLKQGLDISSTDFPDSLQRGFMLSVIPYQSFYMKQNPQIDYFRFEKGSYNGFKAILLTRNDLQSREVDNTIYWRSELKIVNKQQDQIYILVFGKRHEKDAEPSWCEFEKIIKSLKIKE